MFTFLRGHTYLSCKVWPSTWNVGKELSTFFFVLDETEFLGVGKCDLKTHIMPTLNWIGKETVVNHHHDVPFKTLERKYTFGADDSENKIIHGDNLEALKALLPEYEGRIKCIYIDPPYNTGNENWVYNDNVNSPKIKKWLGQVVGKESEDLSRHDKWLCMMYPRLKLLREMLSEDGLIFISIDNNESTYLKIICDEIFGTVNFREQITVVGNPGGRDYGGIARMHEYIFVYSKTPQSPISLIEDADGAFKMFDKYGGFELRELRNRNIRFNKENRPNLYYPFFINVNLPDDNDLFPISLEEHEGWYELWPQPSQGINVVWRWGKEKSKKYLNIDICAKRKKDGGFMIVEKYRESRKMAGSVWYDKDIRTEKGTLQLKEIFNGKSFDYPKPIDLIMRILEMGSTNDEEQFILDSFAGSGTTAHAVLNLNKQDGGNRKFILVEMEDYAENITAERVRRVIKTTGGDFSYYELGERLFDDDGNLNPEIDEEKIRQYVWFSETHSPYSKDDGSRYKLGTFNDTGYYFYFEKERLTTLSDDTLNIVTEHADQYIIYADACIIPEKELSAKHIIFKKIPRDIRRF